MRLGYRGQPVDRKLIRYTVGAVSAIGAIGALMAVSGIQQRFSSLPVLLVIVSVGAAGGWVTAAGGAWKDAPIEGFSGWKFLRSPTVATAWAVPLSFLTNNWVSLLLASGGYAVASIETYKTFLTGGRPPGKFAGRPIQADLPALRSLLAHQHAILWLSMAVAFATTLTRPQHGLRGTDSPPIRFFSDSLLTVVAVATASLGALVICTHRHLRIPEAAASRATR